MEMATRRECAAEIFAVNAEVCWELPEESYAKSKSEGRVTE
jgi:hypothetical protein